MSYQIKKISEPYIDGFATAFDSVARESGFLAYNSAPPISVITALVQQNIEKNWPHFIALDGDKVIGWCEITSMNKPVFEHAGVLGMGVIREYRGNGIGKQLLRTALLTASERGLSRIELTVREQNKVAIQLYEGLGFLKEGRHINSVKINGQYQNHLSMALLIPEND